MVMKGISTPLPRDRVKSRRSSVPFATTSHVSSRVTPVSTAGGKFVPDCLQQAAGGDGGLGSNDGILVDLGLRRMQSGAGEEDKSRQQHYETASFSRVRHGRIS